MKRTKGGESQQGSLRFRPAHFLAAASVVYILFISTKLYHFVMSGVVGGDDTFSAPDSLRREFERGSVRRRDHVVENSVAATARDAGSGYGRISYGILKQMREGSTGNVSRFEMMAREAGSLGFEAWKEAESFAATTEFDSLGALVDEKTESCPSSVSAVGGEKEAVLETDMVMFLPCGLAVGSSITVVGVPQQAHPEWVPKLERARRGEGTVMVSQFVVELQGLKAVEGEEPPKILHLNPRLKGDWSQKLVIEHNTCYRMQWGKAMRCDGDPSGDDDDTVDGLRRCEKWESGEDADSKESKSWLHRFVGRANKPDVTWPFPFTEEKMFVLTIRAGREGYHIFIGGHHMTSFAYRTGFALEDATGLAIKGNVDIKSIYATSLPTSHPSFSLQNVLEMSEKWKAPPLPENPLLFIGVLSATNHFAERMAIRKTWMQSAEIKMSSVVAHFFVALNSRKEVNAVLKKEAEYFGDIVILPFIDQYDLVVLKTIAICEYGAKNLSAAYIMKCDDDTFVRLSAVLREIKEIPHGKSVYMGNLNLHHRPLRTGKWAVTFEEWSEEVYPTYANGPGYLISNDIANFIVSQHANHTLRLFKMEDVSMGMWVKQFDTAAAAAGASPVMYSHSRRFCQPGCVGNYFTAHYQSPRQMVCLWDKLLRGRAQCCNFR